jgi:hypothetical protein
MGTEIWVEKTQEGRGEETGGEAHRRQKRKAQDREGGHEQRKTRT